MNDLEFIEDYFSGNLSQADRITFEKKCESDVSFAEEVSFYILSRQALLDTLKEERAYEFKEQFKELSKGEVKTHVIGRNWFAYISAAAACIVILLAYLKFFPKQTAGDLSSRYITENLSTLSVTMGAEQDSLQIGINAYNQKEYRTAESIFDALSRHEDLRPETTKYLGLTYLQTGEFDKALEKFNSLTSYTQLYVNPGKFYLAITLLQRNKKGDEAQAKQLLEEVVAKKLPGYKEASVWLKRI